MGRQIKNVLTVIVAVLSLGGCLPPVAVGTLKPIGTFNSTGDGLVASHSFEGENSYIQFAIERSLPTNDPQPDNWIWPDTVNLRVVDHTGVTLASGPFTTSELTIFDDRTVITFGAGGRLEAGRRYSVEVVFKKGGGSRRDAQYSLHLFYYRPLSQREKWAEKFGWDA